MEETKLDENNASSRSFLAKKEKLKKFLCSNCLLELVGFYCKRRQRIVLSERRIRPKSNNTLSKKFVCQETELSILYSISVQELFKDRDALDSSSFPLQAKKVD